MEIIDIAIFLHFGNGSRYTLVVIEKVFSPSKCTFIKTYQVMIVVNSTVAEEGKRHELFRDYA